MTTHFEKISKNNRYGYGRVSSKEQAKILLWSHKKLN
jgi:hypothetical protein